MFLFMSVIICLFHAVTKQFPIMCQPKAQDTRHQHTRIRARSLYTMSQGKARMEKAIHPNMTMCKLSFVPISLLRLECFCNAN